MSVCCCVSVFHLSNVPVVELCRDLNPLSVFVHCEVDLGVSPLQYDVVPVLIV